MSYRQWWLTNFVSLGVAALHTFPTLLYSPEDRLIALATFFLLHGFGLGWMHTPGSNFPSLRKFLSILIYGCIYSIAAIFSMWLGLVLAVAYFIGVIFTIPLLEKLTVDYGSNPSLLGSFVFLLGSFVFLGSLTILTSFFSGGVTGVILGSFGKHLFGISKPGWVRDLITALALAGMTLGGGLFYLLLIFIYSSFEIHMETRWFTDLLVSIMTVVLMSTAMSYFTYDRRQTATQADLDQ